MNSHQRRVRRRYLERLWQELDAHIEGMRGFEARFTELMQTGATVVEMTDKRYELRAVFPERGTPNLRCPKCGSVYHSLRQGELGWCYACRGEP